MIHEWHQVKQTVVVITRDWSAKDARMACYERGVEGVWHSLGFNTGVVVGRNGMGWGRGLHDLSWAEANEPVKREGDGRSPAGVFALTTVFGEGAAPGFVRMKYLCCGEHSRWVDDPESAFYNQFVEEHASEATRWKTAESMERSDRLYRLGVVVEHNANPVVSGAGSCIFVHAWRGPGQASSGCTAMDEASLERLVAWLDPEARPALAQLPRCAFDRVAQDLGLPEL